MHEFDEGLDSFRSRSVLQKSWTNSVNASVVSTAAKVHLQKFWIVVLHWNEALDEQTPFCRLRKGIVDADKAFASSGMALSTTIWCFAGPGMAFWAPRQVLLALERRSWRWKEDFNPRRLRVL